MQIMSKYKQWKDTTICITKKFLGLDILMGQLRKSSIHDDLSTDLQIETPIFGSNASK